MELRAYETYRGNVEPVAVEARRRGVPVPRPWGWGGTKLLVVTGTTLIIPLLGCSDSSKRTGQRESERSLTPDRSQPATGSPIYRSTADSVTSPLPNAVMPYKSVRVYSADNSEVNPPGSAGAFALDDPRHMTIALHPAAAMGTARRVPDPGDGVSAKVLEALDLRGTTWYRVKIGDEEGWVMESFVK